ncbi:hypothetical protein PHO31112_03448 [Pandoraea horticolens]|uniref:DUF4148 domain-containing protein n=1 Tax=Pandoraea horticolens TaxID=2508298 RepID=A0A5E4WRY6_9BURK|nr:hypothetical protein [Pandoraea horticolens]VVE27261.1 hypothetical protein PHO31112_03448 [Pandoraea horticolens]
MRHRQFIAVCLCLTGALMFGEANAQSYLGAGDLGSIRQTNQTPAVPPAVSALGGRKDSVVDAQSASATINRAASERNGPATGPSQQEQEATTRALDTRNLQHPRQTRSFDSLPRLSRPE